MADVWLRYAAYLETQLKNVSSLQLDLYSRAIRNIPWSGAVWASYIRCLVRSRHSRISCDNGIFVTPSLSDVPQERFQKPKEEVSALFERALTSGLSTPDDCYEVFTVRRHFADQFALHRLYMI